MTFFQTTAEFFSTPHALQNTMLDLCDKIPICVFKIASTDGASSSEVPSDIQQKMRLRSDYMQMLLKQLKGSIYFIFSNSKYHFLIFNFCKPWLEKSIIKIDSFALVHTKYFNFTDEYQ